MSVFDYPRLNVQGTIQLNPGTANNDDYAANATLPATWGPVAGAPLGLIDSIRVEARTYGMSDADFIAWVQKAHRFEGAGTPIIPAEWNYYGDMSATIDAAMGTTVVGVQTGPDAAHAAPIDGVALSSCVGAVLTLSGGITDINPEGSPPATQFFIEQLALTLGGKTLVGARHSKAVGQWINFYRNANIPADGGAGAYVYHDLPGADVDLPGWPANANGVVFRYYLFRALLADPDKGGSNAGIEALYERKATNPKNLQIVGTLAPLLDERIVSAPTGRLLTSDTTNIPTPPGTKNNGGGRLALGPAVIHQNAQILSCDFCGTFPEIYQDDGANPKLDFGEVTLAVVRGNETVAIGPIDYASTSAGDAAGWLFDFDLTVHDAARKLLDDDGATLQLLHPVHGSVLAETDYYLVSNQQAVYAEQHGSRRSFLNKGTEEPITVIAYRRGRELTGDARPIMTVWQYRAAPLEAPGDAVAISTSFRPGDVLEADTSQPGNRLFTFTINGPADPPPAGYPPKRYATFMNPPYVTNAPQISMRILPNDEDFTGYYVEAEAAEPVGNEHLTFDVVYDKVLRTYYLLYPAMNRVFALNDPTAVENMACAILERTDPKLWLSTAYMPRTRDLSASRRTLLQAWCRKVKPKSADA